MRVQSRRRTNSLALAYNKLQNLFKVALLVAAFAFIKASFLSAATET
jgi:hypothetical protein